MIFPVCLFDPSTFCFRDGLIEANEVNDLVLSELLPIFPDPRGKFAPNYSHPYGVKKVFPGGALILTKWMVVNFLLQSILMLSRSVTHD